MSARGGRKLIAIGDLHGSFDSFVEIVRRLGIVSGDLELDIDDADLVFIGDVCDRGTNSRRIYELIIEWQRSAPARDSSIRFILGNHEVMNSLGMRHYNTLDEYLSFDPASRSAGERAHAHAFSRGGWLHAWLTAQCAMLKIGPFVFAHADLPMDLAEWTVDEVNTRVMESFRSTSGATSTNSLPDSLFGPSQSVLWCRQAQVEPPNGYEAALRRFLAKNDASVYVCGHTPAEDGLFHVLYGGRYLCIDTAITFERMGFGRKSALVVEGGRAVAAYLERNDVRYVPLALSHPRK